MIRKVLWKVAEKSFNRDSEKFYNIIKDLDKG